MQQIAVRGRSLLRQPSFTGSAGKLAEQERQFISQSTKAALAIAKIRGVKLGGARPHLKAHNQEQARQLKLEAMSIAPFVLPLREKGTSLRQTTAALNEFGLKTQKGSKWHLSRVAEVCQYLKGNMNDDKNFSTINRILLTRSLHSLELLQQSKTT